MLNATELRIGNLVKWVSSGDEYSELVMRMDIGNLKALFDKQIRVEGVGITTDFLLSNGFKNGDYHTNWFSHIDLNCHLVQFSDGEYVLEGVDDIRLSEGFRYVHELENIFHCLTRKEMNAVANGS